jgi:hypothetical protein
MNSIRDRLRRGIVSQDVCAFGGLEYLVLDLRGFSMSEVERQCMTRKIREMYGVVGLRVVVVDQAKRLGRASRWDWALLG